MDASYTSINPFDGTRTDKISILLQGEIVPGDYDRLLDSVAKNLFQYALRTPDVLLASPGGDLQEALKIARFVKETYRSVAVGPATGPCVSACFFIYVTAPHRLAAAPNLGVHRPYIHPQRLQSLSLADAESLQKNLLREARAHLQDLNVPTAIIDAMFQRASTEVYWLSDYQIDVQLGMRPPWYEQYLIAQCGLDKTVERKALAGSSDPALRAQIQRVNECADQKTQAASLGFIVQELKRAGKWPIKKREGTPRDLEEELDRALAEELDKALGNDPRSPLPRK
jgi:hypothetical protein